MTRRTAAWLCVVGLAALGCGGPTDQPGDTGARDAARTFAEAIAAQQWSVAYDQLHTESRRQLSPDEFERRARQYRRNLGLELASVLVRSCEEQGEEAKAQLVFSGAARSGSRQFRDSFLLRRGSGGWGIVLPRQFGRSKAD